MKLSPIINAEGEYIFDCPGCKCSHQIWTKPGNPDNGAKWGFNGDMERPTITPSILVRWTDTKNEYPKNMICHMIITDGKINYCSDSTHELAGQTVEMIDI